MQELGYLVSPLRFPQLLGPLDGAAFRLVPEAHLLAQPTGKLIGIGGDLDADTVQVQRVLVEGPRHEVAADIPLVCKFAVEEDEVRVALQAHLDLI